MQCKNDMHIPQDSYNYVPSRIAFGSCLNQWLDTDLLDYVKNYEIFVFLGDNVYSDTNWWIQLKKWCYNKLSCDSRFQSLVARIPVVLAVWDDHDYGDNDATSSFVLKQDSRDLFLNFWKIPPKNERAMHKELYHVHRFKNASYSLNIVLLDLRYNRDAQKGCQGNESMPWNYYCPDSSAHIMSESQWKWLESVLQEVVDVTIIVSSTQLAHSWNGWESWTLYPTDLQRFFSITQSKPSKIIVISGDLHSAEISHQKHIWDITSSGITHFNSDSRPNSYRVGNVFHSLNFADIIIDWFRFNIQTNFYNGEGQLLQHTALDL